MIDLSKRIFITGVTGFVGANLLLRLLELGATDVHVLIRSNSDISRIEDYISRVTSHSFSLEEREQVFVRIGEIQPEIVFHIAASGTAVGRVSLSIEDLIQSNTLGSMNLMDACLAAGVCEIFVNTGSSSEYGQSDLPMKESDILIPNNPYGLSKAGATQYATYLGKQKAFPISTYRIFAAYGPREDSKRLIPTLLYSAIHNTPPKLTSPYPMRDFIYVGDIVESYLQADRAIKNPGEIINLGSGKQYSIGEVLAIIQHISKSNLIPEYGEIVANQTEPTSWVSDNTKMRTILGVLPTPLASGLDLTLQWMRNSL